MNQKIKDLVEQSGGRYYSEHAGAEIVVDGCYVFEPAELEALVRAVLVVPEAVLQGLDSGLPLGFNASPRRAENSLSDILSRMKPSAGSDISNVRQHSIRVKNALTVIKEITGD